MNHDQESYLHHISFEVVIRYSSTSSKKLDIQAWSLMKRFRQEIYI